MNDYMREALNLCAVHEVEFCGVQTEFDEGVLPFAEVGNIISAVFYAIGRVEE